MAVWIGLLLVVTKLSYSLVKFGNRIRNEASSTIKKALGIVLMGIGALIGIAMVAVILINIYSSIPYLLGNKH
jgi:hypothetical protein